MQMVMGPAGTGKSTYCKVMQEHCQNARRSVHVVNLDPAAESFEYEVAFDIRGESCDVGSSPLFGSSIRVSHGVFLFGSFPERRGLSRFAAPSLLAALGGPHHGLRPRSVPARRTAPVGRKRESRKCLDCEVPYSLRPPCRPLCAFLVS